MRTLSLLGVSVIAGLLAGCGPDEPRHTEAPPRVLDRVTKPAAKKKKSSPGSAKGSGGFGFNEKAAAAGVDRSPTKRNVVAPEMDQLENMLSREQPAEGSAGLWECGRCKQQAPKAGKCCGDDRHKIG